MTEQAKVPLKFPSPKKRISLNNLLYYVNKHVLNNLLHLTLKRQGDFITKNFNSMK